MAWRCATFILVSALVAACGSDERGSSGDGSGGAGASSSVTSAVGGAPTGGSGVGAGISECSYCEEITCTCPNGTPFTAAPCIADGTCTSVCESVVPAFCGSATSSSGASSGSGATASSTGSGGYDPYCVQVADHTCDVMNTCISAPNCKGSDSWETMASGCDIFMQGCPGYLECVLGASTCDQLTQCQQQYCSN
jgi:hypothetical protein